MNIWISRSPLYTDINGNEQSLFSVVAWDYTGIGIKGMLLVVDGVERGGCNGKGTFATCETYLVMEPGEHQYWAMMTDYVGHTKYSDVADFFVKKLIEPATISGNVSDLSINLPVDVWYAIIPENERSSSGEYGFAYARTVNGKFQEQLHPGRYTVVIATMDYMAFLQNPRDPNSRGTSWTQESSGGVLTFYMTINIEVRDGVTTNTNFSLFCSRYDSNCILPPPLGLG
ncbi:MAG: hypothetical protein Q7S63_01695 [bacterium]|nr:hypothetical protein [bacterium]